MVYIAKLLISGRQKIALALLLAAIVGFLSYYPRITEAILAFCLGGVVPGTNVVLSPMVVLAIVAGVFILGILTLGLRMYFRAGHRSRNFIQIPVTAVSSVEHLEISSSTAAVSQEIEPDKLTRSHGLRRRQRIALAMTVMSRCMSHAARITSLRTERFMRASRGLLVKWTRAAGIALDTFLGLIWMGISVAVTLILSASIRTGRAAVQTARRVWNWSKPRLHRLDAWLEIQTRKFETKVRNRLNSHETVRVVSGIGREYSKSVHELHPKTALRTARQKAGRIKAKVITTAQR